MCGFKKKVGKLHETMAQPVEIAHYRNVKNYMKIPRGVTFKPGECVLYYDRNYIRHCNIPDLKSPT